MDTDGDGVGDACDTLIGCFGTNVLQIIEVCTNNPNTERKWSIYNAGTCETQVSWEIHKSNGKGTLSVPAGEERFISTGEVSKRGPTQLIVSWTNSTGSLSQTKYNSHGITCSSSFGAELQDAVNPLKVYPNPMTGNGIWLQFPPSGNKELFTVSVYDFSGRLQAQTLLEVEGDGQPLFWGLNHSRWNKGSYLLTAEGTSRKYQVQLVR